MYIVYSEDKEKKQKYLIIEKNVDKCAGLVAAGESVLQGDALDPNVLKKSRIEKLSVF